MSGTEYQREKEKVAAIMLAKQKAGKYTLCATQGQTLANSQ